MTRRAQNRTTIARAQNLTASARSTKLAPIAALAAIAAALLVAACGGSAPASTTSHASAADNALNFSKCMREHGVKDFPNPEISGGRVALRFNTKAGSGPSPQTLESAQLACRHFQAFARPNLTPAEKVAREEAVLKFARCMREHGIKVHASTAGGGIQVSIKGGPSSGGPNPESPAFQNAQKDCQGLLPFKGGPGPGPSTSSSGGAKGSGAGLSIGG